MKANQLTFGVEIECLVPETMVLAAGGYHSGQPIPELPRWNCQTDRSLSSEPGFRTVEVVSPVLKGEDGLCNMADTYLWLKENGAKVNGSCGFHIHIGAKDFSDEQIQSIMAAFRKYELAFFALNGSEMASRYNSRYCANSQAWTDQNLPSDTAGAQNHYKRYRSLNTTNVGRGRRSTIEFRLFAATMEPEAAVTAVYMVCALVAKAASEVSGDATRLPITESVETFLSQHYSDTSNWSIIEDESPADISTELMRKYNESRA